MTARRAPLAITHLVVTDVFAGTERYVAEVSRALAERGHDVHVVGGHPRAMAEHLADSPVRWRPGADSGSAVRALLRGGRRQIVHSHMTKADYLAFLTAPAVGGRRVSSRHITVPRGWSRAARAFERPVRLALSAEIAVSRWTSQQLARPADLVVVNGVRDAPDVDHTREPVVLVAQRLAPEKDTSTAIRAFAASGLAGSGWLLVVAGSGPQQQELEVLAAGLDIAAAVRFTGWVDDTASLMRTSGMLLAPAPTEPFGLSVVEAMAHGLPVVAADSAGHRETVGRLPAAATFPAGDHLAAAAQLRRLAADERARRGYGDDLRALQRREFGLPLHVDRLEALYRSITRTL